MARSGPTTPKGLHAAGADLWARLTDVFDLEVGELLLLEQAARQADTVADLDAAVAADGVIVTGAAGQSRLNAAVTELRQSRLALAKLLGELGLPTEDDERPMTAAQRRAQKAARSAAGTGPRARDVARLKRADDDPEVVPTHSRRGPGLARRGDRRGGPRANSPTGSASPPGGRCTARGSPSPLRSLPTPAGPLTNSTRSSSPTVTVGAGSPGSASSPLATTSDETRPQRPRRVGHCARSWLLA